MLWKMLTTTYDPYSLLMNDKRRIKNASTISYKHIMTEKPADLINYDNEQTITRCRVWKK